MHQHVVIFFHLDLNGKKKTEKKERVADFWLDVRKRGGGSFRCVVCATGGGSGFFLNGGGGGEMRM